MGFLSFTAWQFALAGAICAAGPLIIHLLNRRRFRTVEWAAMDFLREALQRNRRILQIRDIILLTLRTAAVLFFGLALAQPFFATHQEEFNDRQPLHAVIVIDNSLSMAYESLEGSLLDKAKDRARQLIEKLPAGSKISIIPACGSREGYSAEPYGTKENALEALDKIAVVDRSASLLRAVNEAKKASEAAPELAKRIVFISDQQQLNWRDLRQSDVLKDLPAMQIVNVAPAEWENTWISDLRVQDGLADVETPATVIVELQHRGPATRQDVLVTISMGDTVLGEKSVSLEPGQGAREVDFEVVFNTLTELPEPDKPVFVPLKAAITPDRLALDDERYLTVPVVAALPVVFVDQYGAEGEDPIRNRIGETRPLRKLLAPKTARSDAPRQLVQVRHVTIDELTQDLLADARLVVIAGVQDPGSQTELLRDYVEQGGQLVIAAGDAFDPAAWNAAAWNDGAGILPLPLSREPIGEVPEVAGASLKAFHLSFESLAGEEYFQLATVSEAELRDLYSEPFFFKAVKIDDSRETLDALRASEMKRLEDELAAIGDTQRRREELAAKEAKGEISATEREQLRQDEASLRELRPQWLAWSASIQETASPADAVMPENVAERARRLETLALQRAPQVLARFEQEGQPPYLVSRQIGRGQVIFAASGLASSWNTLATTNTVVIFDRILRSMTQATLPRRNFPAMERITLPLPVESPNLAVALARPGHKQPDEPLDVGYISTERRGVTVPSLLERGVYRIVGQTVQGSEQPEPTDAKPAWEIPLTISGDSAESDLAALSEEDFDELAGSANLRWVGAGQEVSLAGVAIRGQTSWWWLIVLVLGILLVEMLIVAWPNVKAHEPIPAST